MIRPGRSMTQRRGLRPLAAVKCSGEVEAALDLRLLRIVIALKPPVAYLDRPTQKQMRRSVDPELPVGSPRS